MTHLLNQKFIFDFDSTFIQIEAIDILAELSLKNDPHYTEKIEAFREITRKSMEGKLSYQESISERFSYLALTKDHIQQAIAIIQHKITPSFLRNKAFFQANPDRIYVISGMFIEILWPIVRTFGLKKEHVFGNRFLYDFEGNIKDYDRNYPLAQDQSKVKLVHQLNLDGDIIMVGDGYNDYELKEAGLVKTFIAFTENITRKSVVNVADAVINNLEGLFIVCGLSTPAELIPPKVLLLENIHSDVKEYYQQLGYQVESHPNALSESELIQKLPQINLLGIRSKTQLTEKCLKNATHLEAIGAFCIGTNQIDLNACSKQGIAVFNAPYSNTRSVVELAIAEIIMLARKTMESSALLKQGFWHKTSEGSHEIRGKTLGIVGYGHIGSQLSIIAEALGMRVIFFDIVEKLPLGNAKAAASLQEVLSEADFISLHVDGRPENANMIGKSEFALMKKSAHFLNLSRDFIVDTSALVNRLHEKKIAGAAIDVFSHEPLASKSEFKTPLAACDNVILTPHIGGSTEEAQSNIGSYVSQHLVDYLEAGQTIGSVNFPPLMLPITHKDSDHFSQGASSQSELYSSRINLTSSQIERERIIHIHHNVPGILAQINAYFAKAEINILGQLLKTNETLGYVITDLNQKLSDTDFAELSKIPHTIKVRKILL